MMLTKVGQKKFLNGININFNPPSDESKMVHQES